MIPCFLDSLGIYVGEFNFLMFLDWNLTVLLILFYNVCMILSPAFYNVFSVVKNCLCLILVLICKRSFSGTISSAFTTNQFEESKCVPGTSCFP
uniref:Uncharacterized protein n=1 Tax=Solanum lycopersicum TaxID=4081 RepID=A0A3Q7EPB8_SOLLC